MNPIYMENGKLSPLSSVELYKTINFHVPTGLVLAISNKYLLDLDF